MIEASGLTVGDRLPTENELAVRLGVARSTIREAMKAWQYMGIVTRNKSAGTVLATEVCSNSVHVPLTLKLEAESLLRTYSVRRPLEIEATRLATINAGKADRKTILVRMRELMAVYAADEDWRPADARFHAAIHQASGNPLFGQLIHQLQAVFHDIYPDPFGLPLLGENSIPIHRDLAEAVVAGHSDEAIRCMREITDIVETEVRTHVDGS